MATGKGQAVGFVYALDKTIEEIGATVLKGDDYANKIVFTAEGIVLDGNIVAEPNSDVFGSMVVECYQKETGDNPTTLYSDSACTEATKITPSTSKLYYVKGTGRTLEWVADLGYYATVSDVYTALKGLIDGLGDTYASKSSVQELTLSVSAMDSRVTANASNITTNASNITTNANNIKAINDSKGAANGIATLGSDSKVTPSQLPQASTTVAGITKLTDSLETQYSALPPQAGAVLAAFSDLKNNYLPTNYIKSSLRGAANGVAPLNDSGIIDSTYLPSYVDDVIEGYYLVYSGSVKAFFTQNEAKTEYLIVPETGKIYVDLNTNKTYRYGGSAYVEISESLAIGTTEGTAFSGKSGYDHVNNTNNPHSVTKAQVGLGNVDNTADADKSVLSAAIAFCDGASNVITDTYLRKDAVQSASLEGKSKTEVPSVSLVFSETAKIWTGTQAEYDALTSYDSRTAYLITDPDIVYSDLNFGIFYGTNKPTSAEAGAVFHALYTNGVLKNRQVYMRCNTSSHGDSGYHLVEYRGQKTIGSYSYEVFACYIGGEYGLAVAFLGTGESTANYEKVQQGKVVYGIYESITSESTNDAAAGGKAVYDLVSPLVTQLTWQ